MWQGRSDGYLAVRYIEFGNETNMGYQYGGVWSGPSYTARAQTYAERARDAQEAIDSPAGNPNVGLLVQGDSGDCNWQAPRSDPCSQWVDGMFSAVPDLNKRIAGWTAHPYGPPTSYMANMQRVVANTAKHGDTTLPIFITEYGISSDNGRCLSDNMGWPKCLTYQQAAADLHGAIADLHRNFPRLAAMFIYEQRDIKGTGTSNDREGYFGAIQSNGAPKGAYTSEIQWELNTYRG